MRRFFALVCILALVGCQPGKHSETWRTVVETRPALSGRAEERSAMYAEALHVTLAQRGVPHVLVTFEYTHGLRMQVSLTKRRTVVIYRDERRPKYPWWLADEGLLQPVWLPNAPFAQQVDFYLRRPARVLEVRDYTQPRDVKRDIPPQREKAEPPRRIGVSRIQPAPVRKAKSTPAVQKPAPTPVPKEATSTLQLVPAKPEQPSPVSPAPAVPAQAAPPQAAPSPIKKGALIQKEDATPQAVLLPDPLPVVKPVPTAPAVKPQPNAVPAQP